jgi:spore coat polysaccharide biosynthesis predicted glycosyltransferase SpsG
MDDGDRFTGAAAIVIQPSQGRWAGPGRAGRILAGYGVVPLATTFKNLRTTSSGRPPGPGTASVLACFGGSDPARVTERLAGSLSGRGWDLDLVIGASYSGSTQGWPVEPIRDPADLPQRLAAADVVVLAAGTMKFEAACLGRPAILLAVADDQLAVGPPFAATGAAVFLGDGRIVDPGLVHAAIADLVEDGERRAAIGRRAAELIDGDGADRIAAAMSELASALRG